MRDYQIKNLTETQLEFQINKPWYKFKMVRDTKRPVGWWLPFRKKATEKFKKMVEDLKKQMEKERTKKFARRNVY
ncbi:hypothetical protein KJ641_03020 [Patescibacteria group bacterium]|nr:hypothetical protein [Patescibacteria group bacterium]MBU1895814.1 hypothetical protein [Patescibacteria group bacterium]